MLSKHCNDIDCFATKQGYYYDLIVAKRLAKRLAILAAVGWSLLAANLVFTYIVN